MELRCCEAWHERLVAQGRPLVTAKLEPGPENESPDVVAGDVAIEVTVLMHPDAAAVIARRMAIARERPLTVGDLKENRSPQILPKEQVQAMLLGLIAGKDACDFGKYGKRERVLLILARWQDLVWTEFLEIARDHEFQLPHHRLTRAFVMRSGDHPVIELRLR
jgi:hypothetical protein